MRIVVDTNVLVSMALAKHGTMQRLRQYWREGRFSVLESKDLINEVREVLEYPRLAALFTAEAKKTVLIELETLAENVTLKKPYPTFEKDEDDQFLLAMVRDGDADCLVTGDKKLLELGRFEGKPIFTVAQLVERFEEKQ